MALLSDMSWFEVQEHLVIDDRIILPIGATEAHGRHLALGTDFFEAEAVAIGTGKALNVMVAPTLNYGQSHSLLGFSGTIALKPSTLICVIEDILRSIYHHGFRRIFIINGHGGNKCSIQTAFCNVIEDLPELRVKLFEWWDDKEVYATIEEMMGKQVGTHGTDGETAFMMAIKPEGVKMHLLTGKDAPKISSIEQITLSNFRKFYPDGHIGLLPTKATAEFGRKILEITIEICSRELSNW